MRSQSKNVMKSKISILNTKSIIQALLQLPKLKYFT